LVHKVFLGGSVDGARIISWGGGNWKTQFDIYRWKDVQTVEPGFQVHFEMGRPVYLIAKYASSLHIYQVEGGVKRWIVDIPAFEATGYQWSDVEIMYNCAELRNRSMGETIPPGQGPAPQP
jgi:hypothetical protein